MVRLLLFILLLSPVAVGIPRIAFATQNDDFIVNENQGIVIARFKTQAPKETEKLSGDVLELMRLFGITMSQESLIESKEGRLLYKTFQKNAFGEKSEFHEMRWQDGDYFIVATVLNESAESFRALKNLPRNPWAKRKTANSETEAGICPSCESSKFMKPLDEWAKSAREWVAVDCQAEKVDGKVTAGKIMSSVGSCLRGVALSVVDLAKLLYDLLSTQVKFYSDPKYAIAFSKVIWEAVRHPQNFLQNLFTMVWQAAKDQWGKLKTCSVDYQVGFTCQLLVDFLVPGGIIVKGIKSGAMVGKTAAAAVRGVISAEAKVTASSVRTVMKATDEVAFSARSVADDVEYVATANGKEAVRVTGDEVGTHIKDVEIPNDDILKMEAARTGELDVTAKAILDEISPTYPSRRREIEETYRKILEEDPKTNPNLKPEVHAQRVNRLAALLVEEMQAKGIKAKIVWSRDLLGKTVDQLKQELAQSGKKLEGLKQDFKNATSFQRSRLQKAIDSTQSERAKILAEIQKANAPNVAVRIDIDMASNKILQSAREKLDIPEISIPFEHFQKEAGMAGFLQNATNGIGIHLDNVLNPNGVVSGVLFHEVHHGAKTTALRKAQDSIQKKMKEGVGAIRAIRVRDYPFFGEAKAKRGETVTSFHGYTSYFASDEVPAYARSLAYVLRGLENTTTISARGVLRKPSNAIAVEIAGKLKNAAQSNLNIAKMLRDHLETKGMKEVLVIPGTAKDLPTVQIPLVRNGKEVGTYTFHPLALQNKYAGSSRQIIEGFIRRMEAASTAHLSRAEEILTMPPVDLTKRIQELTERSKNARGRGGSGKADRSGIE